MIDAISVLQKNTVRPTPARQKILEYFARIKDPVSVEEIKTDPKLKKLKMDTVTIYRILHLFTQKKILREIDLHEGKFRYELSSQEHHHHIVCIHCGRIQDVDTCLEDRWKKQLEKSTKFAIQSHSLEFFGLCKSCQ